MGKKYCCVPGCSNTSSSVDCNGNKVILHRLPMSEKKKKIKKEWIRRLNTVRANLVINDNTRVCSDHFNGDFTDSSIPTIFPSKVQKEKPIRRPLMRHFEEVENVDPCTDIELDEKNINHLNGMACADIDECASSSFDIQGIQNIQGRKFVQLYRTETEVYSYIPNTKIEKPTMVDVGIQTNLPTLRPEDLKNNDSKTRFYTGFISYGMFMHFFLTILKHGADNLHYWEGEKRSAGAEKTYHHDETKKPGRKRFLRPEDEFLLVCMRLRLGLLQEHLADIFCISTTSVSRIINTWLNFLYDHCKSLVAWPSRQQILCNLPRSFMDYKQCRVVIDCTEIFTEKPSSLVNQWLTWSEYKHHNTFKLLIGVAPNGLVSFVSRLWCGNTSDRHMVEKDSLLPLLTPGDMIMADKGFTIEDILPAEVDINMPPRIPSNRQLTENEFFSTQGIASARIVVEMKMEQLKNYRILAGPLPLSEAHLAEQTAFLCVAFTNFLPPLLK